ncbi:sulfatase family protein [Aegicerativicinus sediminis]|uniref:sulfatase family protein n=1 Tax=Aegicerativicinus sediminis TaxID=2893202 RepID=UPI001E3D59A5|nr:sulfatase [Aegicerativicinus sediminis]
MKAFIFIICSLFISFTSKAQEKPNVLWIVTEDISPTLSMYGDSTAQTPNLDMLARESMVYDNAFAVVGVCAPTRSSIITGMYPTTIGTMHMRTGQDVMSWGKRSYEGKEALARTDLDGNEIRQYAAVIPDYVKCYTEYLRAEGYFCTNNQKTDYQFAAPVTAWDENNTKAHWGNRLDEKTPFFSVFNIGVTHESRLWVNDDLPLTVNPKDVKVPPYLPDNEATRKTVARHYSNVELMDKEVGNLIKQLKEDGLYDKTIIFFYSDHGGPLPRQKREIYDSGLKVPFMVKGITGEVGRTDRLISFVDLAPTMLSLAGIKPPEYLEGKAFLGSYKAENRNYVFGSSDRFDEYSDRIRAVRNKQYLYLRNDYPNLPKYKDVGYRKNIPMMPVFLKLKEMGKLNTIQQSWFETKTEEELYDCENDPFNIHNLAEDHKYATILAEMRKALENHLENRHDMGLQPEAQLINNMWPNFQQPITEQVEIKKIGATIELTSKTKGASIAYIISENANEKLDFNSGWKLYSKPLALEYGKYLYSLAQRIGFKETEIQVFKM